MLMVYLADGTAKQIDPADPAPLPNDALWYDLESPSAAEEHLVEACLGLNIPTREEMAEIEITSRLYRDGDHNFMTAQVINRVDNLLTLHSVTFILHQKRLITVRYGQTKHFTSLVPRLAKYVQHAKLTPVAVLLALLEMIIDECADTLEALGTEMDALARRVFNPKSKDHKPPGTHQFKETMRQVGRDGENISLARESLLSLNRMLHYLQNADGTQALLDNFVTQLGNMDRDVESLSQHVEFMLEKVQFILDATLGMISIEQNDVMKITGVASMLFMPPTLIASIYGMNFKWMPELDWHLGYPLALAMMLTTAGFSYAYFKRRGWL